MPAVIFKNRTKYVVTPILDDELSHGKHKHAARLKKEVGIQISLKFSFVFKQSAFQEGVVSL